MYPRHTTLFMGLLLLESTFRNFKTTILSNYFVINEAIWNRIIHSRSSFSLTRSIKSLSCPRPGVCIIHEKRNNSTLTPQPLLCITTSIHWLIFANQNIDNIKCKLINFVQYLQKTGSRQRAVQLYFLSFVVIFIYFSVLEVEYYFGW